MADVGFSTAGDSSPPPLISRCPMLMRSIGPRGFAPWRMLAVVFLLMVRVAPCQAQVEVDSQLPDYRFDATGISGQIKTVGSDTMNNLMLLWTERFKEGYRSVRAEVEGAGSSKAMPALLEGAASFGPMSRELKASETNEFEKKFGYKPVLLPTSIDMLAVFVHRDNPIESMTLAQVDAIFSSTRKMGAPQPINRWGQLGLAGSYANAPITMFSRNAASGTYGFFKEMVMGNGDFRDEVSEQPGSPAVIQSVGSNPMAIGYSGIGYKTEGVKAIALAADANQPAIAPTAENAYSGDYPLSRYLYLVVNYKPQSQLDPLRREFLRFLYSKQGQRLVIQDGYYPVDAQTAREALQSVGIDPKF